MRKRKMVNIEDIASVHLGKAGKEKHISSSEKMHRMVHCATQAAAVGDLVNVEAIDLQGRSTPLVFEAMSSNNQQIRISLQTLSPGCYHLRVANRVNQIVQTPWITVVR